MSSKSVCRKFLEDFACAHVNDGFMEDNGARMLGFMNNLEGSPLLKVKELKDKGNGLFRQRYFDLVAACYDEACKLLSLTIGVIGGDDVESTSDIAISLNSNLAACALKIEEYQATLDLCSMILDSFPQNVKALFRTAMAFMKLKRFSEAESDLNEALVVEPRNKDVLRELATVKGHLLMKDNGKRALEVAHVVSVDTDNRKHVRVSESFESENMDLSNDLSNHGVETDMRKEDIERVNMEVMDMSTSSTDLGTNLTNTKTEHGSKMSFLEFSKQDGGNSRLRISRQSYQKLLEGKELSFYHKRHLSTTSIRIINIETPKKRDTTKDHKRRRRRRRKRCHKRENSNMTIDLKEDMARLDYINVESVGPCTRPSASCDNFTSSDSQFLQVYPKNAAHDSSLPLSPVFDNVNLTLPKAHNASKDQDPPLISTSSKKCKMFSVPFDTFQTFQCSRSTPLFCRYPFNHRAKEKMRRRIITPKKNYSQRDESPRQFIYLLTK